MIPVFADTFYWVALLNPEDSAHDAVVTYSRRRGAGVVITTDEVLTELLTSCAANPYLRSRAASNVRNLLAHPHMRVMAQGRAGFLDGLELYESRQDKGYSLVDCISMQVMRKEGLIEVLTGDRHFEQEGFRAVFRTT